MQKVIQVKFKSIFILLLLSFSIIFSNSIDLSMANYIISSEINELTKSTIIKILDEEIGERTDLKLFTTNSWNSKNPNIAICLSNSNQLLGKEIPVSQNNDSHEFKKEGFRFVFNETSNNIWIIGADLSGVLFGIGEFLRNIEMSKNSILLRTPVNICTSPKYPIRGHQIGYRNTANSYDAWSVKQYEKYIRELVLFGTNAIENIPLGGKGDESVHMQLSRKKMNVEISNICKAHNIQYWVWIPATIDLKDNQLRKKEINKHDKYYKETPYLSDVFFPGGDPGHNHPKYVLPFLKEVHSKLTKYHPNAGLWISLQGFSEEQIDYFYKYLNDKKPDWLKGVVSGPSSPPIAETRFRLPKKYMHRHYPDITHSVRCDYPAQNFDQAFALTLGREGINPQPVYYAKVHKDYAQFTDGFVSYSDGCHDDVNKFIWSQRGWDPEKSVRDILNEYGRFFFNPKISLKVADGIIALEKNLFGSLTINGGVETTYEFWKKLENEYPNLANNWRWQMLQLRANYDKYTRNRLIYESNLEMVANQILEKVNELGLNNSIEQALNKVYEAETKPIEVGIRKSIDKYCKELFNLIGYQTSVKLYQASGAQRGCILDFVDYPLNNRWWLEDEFHKIDTMNSIEEKKDRLEIIRKWENPGVGSYYNNISNIANSQHVTTTVYDAVDFGWWNNGYSRMRLSSQVYQNEPILEYEDLDPNARYLIRIAGFGDALLRIDGVRMEPILYNKEVDGFKEFIVPKKLVGDGSLKVTFDRPEESHMRWRNYSRISDIWLIKR